MLNQAKNLPFIILRKPFASLRVTEVKSNLVEILCVVVEGTFARHMGCNIPLNPWFVKQQNMLKTLDLPSPSTQNFQRNTLKSIDLPKAVLQITEVWSGHS